MYSIDFSWEENGFEILSQWLPDVIEYLDGIFRLFKNPSSGFQNDPESNDQIGRILDALSLYIKRIFGIDESESFDY
jgi:hypothetical protein